MSQTTVTTVSAGLPVQLGEAKLHLRIEGGDLDIEVQAALEDAVDYCEAVSGRALRESVTVVQTYSEWPSDPIQFNRHPVKSIASVKYQDADNAEQTVLAANYRLHKSTEAAAYLVFDSDFLRPDIYFREDAIAITYVAGYDSIPVVPPRAKRLIKLKLSEFFGNLDERKVEANRRACDDLLRSIDWGAYR